MTNSLIKPLMPIAPRPTTVDAMATVDICAVDKIEHRPRPAKKSDHRPRPAPVQISKINSAPAPSP